MAGTLEGPQSVPEGARQIQLRDGLVHTVYAGFFTIAGGREAILLTFGNLIAQDAVQVEQRTALSPANAKRLAVALGQVIRRYESEHGQIDIASTGEAAPKAGA